MDDADDQDDKERVKRSECLLDQAIVPSNMYKKFQSKINHYHLDAILSNYTHDCWNNKKAVLFILPFHRIYACR